MVTISSTQKIREKKRRFLAREQLIIDAALSLLIDAGIERVTVAEIARQAGIGKGTVYKHFESKSEIMMRIMLDYEKSTATNLLAGIQATENGDPGAVVKAYFESRLANPALDRLVQQLEIRLEEEPSVARQMEELLAIRRSSIAKLSSMVEKLIKRGILENVPPHYHYLASWALAQGAVDVCFNRGFVDQIDDKEGLLRFITNIGVTMGNRGQLRG
ncbi:MAG: TetR/AcrR family transcriptional regulator [Gammaproteobacteria bacterium]|nr:MAG: TetR/AcrR family transcriptional regulator [Gammaproteobacteria bacterium]